MHVSDISKPLRNSITVGNNVTNDFQPGDVEIKPGSKVKMTSGGSVRLSPGFHAESGSEFIATTHVETTCFVEDKSLEPSKTISENQEQDELITTLESHLAEIITSTEKSISVYPNPANTTIIISFNKYSDEKININILDNSGKQISSIKDVNRITEINVSDFQPGFYIIRVSSGEKVYTEKFIKK